MKKQNINRDSIVTTNPQTINIDPKMFETISNALRPDVLNIPPKGYYSVQQLVKIMKMSKAQISRRIKKLKTENSVQEVKCLENFGNRSVAIPYYKFLTFDTTLSDIKIKGCKLNL